jgi:hypothetical protein
MGLEPIISVSVALVVLDIEPELQNRGRAVVANPSGPSGCGELISKLSLPSSINSKSGNHREHEKSTKRCCAIEFIV